MGEPLVGERPLTSAATLVGRDQELAGLARLLIHPEVRVLTVLGPAGVGKTRLAEAVVDVRRSLQVVRVDLDGATDRSEAAGRVAAALGIRVGGADAAVAVESHLGQDPLLLYLDDCERCIELRGLLEFWLTGCVRLRILSTSRRPLQLVAEQVFPVAPLPLPPAQWNGDLAALIEVPSVALLCHRISALQPGWRLDGRNADRISAVCRAADGLPLALELAAARLVRTRPRDDHCAGEPRTLAAAIARSYELLTGHEQTLLRRLAVFPGSWTTAAAESICAEPGVDVRVLLAELTDASLVVPTTPDEAVHGHMMLRTIADFAAGELAVSGEKTAVRDRHLSYFADLAREAEHSFGTSDEGVLVEWLGSEYADLRAAFRHARARRDSGGLLALAAAIGWYCFTRGRLEEGLQVTRRALAETAPDRGSRDRAACLRSGGILACLQGRYPEAHAWLNQALTLAEQFGDRRGCAIAHAFLGHTARLQGRYDSAATHYSAAQAIQAEADNARGVAWAWHDLGLLALERGEPGEAETGLTAAEEWFRGAGDEWALAWVRLALGINALRRGRVASALQLLGQALENYTGLQDRRGMGECVAGFAQAALLLGRDREAARLEGAVLALRELDTVPGWVHSRFPSAAQLRAAAIDRFGLAAYEAERHVGTAMRLPAVCALAYGLTAPDQRVLPVLTPREQQVAAAVATGATNRQIAVRLGMAEKTVESHLTRIMAKLGVNNRTQLAAQVARKPL